MAPPIVLARNPIKKIYIGKLPFFVKFLSPSLPWCMFIQETVNIKIKVLKNKDFDPPILTIPRSFRSNNN